MLCDDVICDDLLGEDGSEEDAGADGTDVTRYLVLSLLVFLGLYRTDFIFHISFEIFVTCYINLQ